MVFEFIYKKDLALKQSRLAFDLAWATNIERSKPYLFISILLMLFGSLIIYLDNWFGLLLIIPGIVFLAWSILIFISYRKGLKEIHSGIDSSIKLEDGKSKIIWEFTDNEFRYSDDLASYNIKWSAFEGFQVRKDHLFMMYDNTKPYLSYMLYKEEVSKDDFNKITDFLKLKIKYIENE